MGGNKYNQHVKKQIINDYKAGVSQIDISKKYNVHKSTVSRVLSSGNTETIHRGGRKRKTTPKEDRKIKRIIQQFPQISSKEIKNTFKLEISAQTIRRRAVEAGLRAYKTVKKPLISKKNRLARLQFARKYLKWSLQKWKCVLFSDETKFNLHGSDGRCFVRRPKGESLNPKYTKGTVKHGGGNVMVWGCFSGQGVGPIHKIEGIMRGEDYKTILSDVMLPYASWEMPLAWVFQHDNDPKHTSKVVKQWISNEQLCVLDWPAQSPDINPIENLWQIVKTKIGNKIFKKPEDLYADVKEQWNTIPQHIIDNLVHSMPRRCAEVIKRRGYAINY